MIDVADTPYAAVDLDAVGRNIRRMQGHCDALGARLRPHVKTHKIPGIAALQIEAGAVGITCQKLGEAEIMAGGGIDDILISFPLVGDAKLRRLAALARRTRLSVTADDEGAVTAMARALAAEGVEVGVLVECETGMGRAGVSTPAQAARLADVIERLDGVRFDGLLTYPTPSEPARLSAFVDGVRAAGIEVKVVSAGGTIQTQAMRERGVVTELRTGTYVYGDRGLVAAGAMSWEDCALRVVATVVSAQSDNRIIVDAGSKALTTDPVESASPVGGYGYLIDDPAAIVHALSEEHGHIDASACARRFAVGDIVTIIPNHACGVTNLHSVVVAFREGRPVGELAVEARGAIR